MCWYPSKIGSETWIINFWYLSSGHWIFTCGRIWESVAIFRSQKGGAANSKGFGQRCSVMLNVRLFSSFYRFWVHALSCCVLRIFEFFFISVAPHSYKIPLFSSAMHFCLSFNEFTWDLILRDFDKIYLEFSSFDKNQLITGILHEDRYTKLCW